MLEFVKSVPTAREESKQPLIDHSREYGFSDTLRLALEREGPEEGTGLVHQGVQSQMADENRSKAQETRKGWQHVLVRGTWHLVACECL